MNNTIKSVPMTLIAGLPDGPWTWTQFGQGWMLVTAYGGSKVVLSALPRGVSRSVLAVRNPDTGTLDDLTPEHPLAKLMIACPALLAFARNTVAEWDNAGMVGAETIAALRGAIDAAGPAPEKAAEVLL